jgi:hypothetical protein
LGHEQLDDAQQQPEKGDDRSAISKRSGYKNQHFPSGVAKPMEPSVLQPISARRVNDLSHFAGEFNSNTHVLLDVMSFA